MSAPAQITSIEAVRQFKLALEEFQVEAREAVTQLLLEMRRAVDWIEHDRARYWPREMQRASDAVLQARNDLERAEMSMSFFYGVINAERRTLHYANAGHPYAYVIPGNGGPAHRLGATSPPLGLTTADKIVGAEFAWRTGKDLLCLFTDGLSEARDAAGEPFGERRLLETVVRHCSRPAAEIVDAVFARLDAFATEVQDDRTLLLVRR